MHIVFSCPNQTVFIFNLLCLLIINIMEMETTHFIKLYRANYAIMCEHARKLGCFDEVHFVLFFVIPPTVNPINLFSHVCHFFSKFTLYFIFFRTQSFFSPWTCFGSLELEAGAVSPNT